MKNIFDDGISSILDEGISTKGIVEKQEQEKPDVPQNPVIVNMQEGTGDTTVQDEELENNPANSQPQPAIIKIEGKPVNSPTQTASEKDGNNNLQKKASSIPETGSIQEKVKSYSDKNEALKDISKKLKRKINELGKVEKANNTLIKDVADPKALSDEFRTKCKEKGLGLKTIASRDGDSIKFKIIETKDRVDLEDFVGYTVSISGLKTNEALVDFVSAVRVVGFEKAVEYMNELDKNNKVELVLLDKEGKKIEDEKTLNNFKRLTVPREQLKDLNISKEEQHFPISDLDSIGNKQDIALNGINGEEDSDIKNSISASPNNSIVLGSVLNAEKEFKPKSLQRTMVDQKIG